VCQIVVGEVDLDAVLSLGNSLEVSCLLSAEAGQSKDVLAALVTCRQFELDLGASAAIGPSFIAPLHARAQPSTFRGTPNAKFKSTKGGSGFKGRR